MNLRYNYPLKNLNTFGIDVVAKQFASFSSVTELQELLKLPEIDKNNLLVLGGGSNVLFTQNFAGTVLLNRIEGINILSEDEDVALVEAGGGVTWHDLVLFAIDKELGGIENLSLIPGTVGAAPLQNIGAYGVELKDVFYILEAVEISTGKISTFNAEQCNFGYRESIFKKTLKGQYIVTHVVLQLSKKPVFNTSYGAISNTLEAMQVKNITLKALSDAVIAIRQSKLPDPALIGNAGSFFKNPEISPEQFADLKEQYPAIPSYPAAHGNIKVPAGWLIEHCGWKGKKINNYGVHKDQALVLVNYGGAEGNQIRALAYEIIESVRQKFGITLQPEVNII
ncbi:UDP-N-acetylenolpyruvoylglucosamine reductase [Adhaeribacter aerolatus]|uniref:UDP-N-acetylenolpyruvoylglucosamine reductase n=1 Tax=Adhaeribacter aerolatus TaxID=670289 RepID=A0A512AWM4_9BACT|nr:UDP-N-acetylmuramate dehydrogenase [Adhaeribacter aerolatus]GEO04104.1 UDP-N-acetylenolpyruvoylglucosamine reductase [Adhaeribacter aerolatus]